MLPKNIINKLLLLIPMLLLFCIGVISAQKQIGASEELTKKAKDHLNLFQYEQALKLLKQGMELEPDNWEPWFLAGRAFMKMKKEGEAERFLVKAHQLNPTELEVQKTLGALYILHAKTAQTKGLGAEMAEFLHKACLAYPGGTKIWQSLLEQWWKAGEYEKIKKEGDLIVKSNSLALEQGDDKSLQAALVLVAKAYYRDSDFIATKNYLQHAGRIRNHNEELYAIKRELENKAEENVRKLVDQASACSGRREYTKALELLQTASKMPGARSSDILEMMDKIEKEASLMKTIGEIDALTAEKKYEEALDKLTEASQQFPEDTQISGRLASVSAVVEKIQQEEAKMNAAALNEKRLKQDHARQLQLFIKEGQDSEQKKNYDLAILSYDKAIKLSPENKELPLKIAELKKLSEVARERQNAFSVRFNEFDGLFSSENFAECFAKGQDLLTEFPENKKSIYAIFAEACLKLGKFDEAREAIINLEGEAEHETLYEYIVGMVHYAKGNRDQALEQLQKVKSKNASFRPDVSTTIYWIYLYKMQFGIYILLIGLAFPAMKAGKEALANWKATSMIKKLEKIKESGDYVANLNFLEERFAREDTPNPKQVQVLLAEALLRTGNPQRAYEMANNLLKKDGRNPLAKRIAGEAAFLIEDTSTQGLDHIQALLKIDESRKDVITFLAKTYIKHQADHKMAQDFILKAISINPADTEAIVFLADVYIKRQTYNQQTLKIFERAAKAAPDVPEYYIAIIENLHRLENPLEAQKWRELAASRFPSQEEFMAERPQTGTVRSGLKLKSQSNEPSGQGAGRSSAPGVFPDYESIGNDEPGAAPSQQGGFPDYDSIGEVEPDAYLPQKKQVAATPTNPVVTGPQKSCPHCSAVIPLKEYYCTTCGKPC